jgi:hypothetical protein
MLCKGDIMSAGKIANRIQAITSEVVRKPCITYIPISNTSNFYPEKIAERFIQEISNSKKLKYSSI